MPPNKQPLYEEAKRGLDVVLSLVGLVVLTPVYLLLMGLVAWEMGLPIFHRRRVLARQAPPADPPPRSLRTFDAFKFRTMVPNADEYLQQHTDLRERFEVRYKLPEGEDPRVTPLGHHLRRLHLDELPQLLNVLRGQMSLVGPRMITPAELSRYGEHGGMLLSVRPGITGWWQINGRGVSYGERVQMDMWYIEHRSLILDLQILWQTLWYLCFRRSAF